MSIQPELPISVPPPDPDVRWLEQLLKGANCWLTARDILLTAGGTQLNDRIVRGLASASAWIISGQKGYKHLEHATPEEIAHCTHWLESQAKRMSDRAGAIRRNAHGRIG